EGSTIALPDLRGLHHLQALVARPGPDIDALELSDHASGHACVGVHQSDLGDLLDDTATAQYRRRLLDLAADIADATSSADPARLERAEAERTALIDELAAATGLGGRRRRVGASDERARMAVRKAVVTALARIEQHDAELARLLRDATRTGTACRFDPDPARPVEWILDPSSS
ncbi:MAG: ATPase, partial [Acidimicrobiales bacterium]